MLSSGIDPTELMNSEKFKTQRHSFINGCQPPPTSAWVLAKLVSSSQNIRPQIVSIPLVRSLAYMIFLHTAFPREETQLHNYQHDGPLSSSFDFSSSTASLSL
jgi:hypothetical protein